MPEQSAVEEMPDEATTSLGGNISISKKKKKKKKSSEGSVSLQGSSVKKEDGGAAPQQQEHAQWQPTSPSPGSTIEVVSTKDEVKAAFAGVALVKGE